MNQKHLSDFKFLLNGKTFFAHKIILCCRSDYFKELFEKEETLDFMEITNISESTFYEILEWIYCGTIPSTLNSNNPLLISFESIFELLQLAEKFQLQFLIQFIQRFLIQNGERIQKLSNENLVKIFPFILEYAASTKKSPLVFFFQCFILKNWNKFVTFPIIERISDKELVQMIINTTNIVLLSHIFKIIFFLIFFKKKIEQIPEIFKLKEKASLKFRPRKQLTKKLDGKNLNICNQIIKDLLKDENSQPFRKPIDPEEWDVPDYYNVIKHPMDLETIQVGLLEYIMVFKV